MRFLSSWCGLERDYDFKSINLLDIILHFMILNYLNMTKRNGYTKRQKEAAAQLLFDNMESVFEPSIVTFAENSLSLLLKRNFFVSLPNESPLITGILATDQETFLAKKRIGKKTLADVNKILKKMNLKVGCLAPISKELKTILEECDIGRTPDFSSVCDALSNIKTNIDCSANLFAIAVLELVNQNSEFQGFLYDLLRGEGKEYNNNRSSSGLVSIFREDARIASSIVRQFNEVVRCRVVLNSDGTHPEYKNVPEHL